MTKIRRVDAYPLRYPEPHDHNNIRYITLARVEAEGGAVGWGECISQFPESAAAVKTIIERGYAPMLTGENALDVERLWHKLLNHIWWYGPQGIAGFAVSAVDMALWDLKGHLLNQPVCRLMGGRVVPRVVAMASIHLDMVDLDWTLNEFQTFKDQGYRIVKGGWGSQPDAVFGLDHAKDLALVRDVREIVGPDCDIVFDVLGGRVKWSAQEAIRRVRDFEAYRLRWIEEPLPPQDYAAHRLLRAGTQTPIGPSAPASRNGIRRATGASEARRRGRGADGPGTVPGDHRLRQGRPADRGPEHSVLRPHLEQCPEYGGERPSPGQLDPRGGHGLQAPHLPHAA